VKQRVDPAALALPSLPESVRQAGEFAMGYALCSFTGALGA